MSWACYAITPKRPVRIVARAVPAAALASARDPNACGLACAHSGWIGQTHTSTCQKGRRHGPYCGASPLCGALAAEATRRCATRNRADLISRAGAIDVAELGKQVCLVSNSISSLPATLSLLGNRPTKVPAARTFLANSAEKPDREMRLALRPSLCALAGTLADVLASGHYVSASAAVEVRPTSGSSAELFRRPLILTG